MDKYRIQIDWLNKLYDDIYYSDLEDSEHALDIITSLISDKEVKPVINDDKNLAGIIIEVSEELADLFDNEGLTACYNLIINKIEKVQDGELDDDFREEYFPDLYDLEEDDEITDEEYVDIDSTVDDDTYVDEYPPEDNENEDDLEYDDY